MRSTTGNDRGVGTRTKYHHGDLPRALKLAALELVRERGPEGFSLRQAATRAGVSTAAPYRHFADREALLAAVAEDGFRELEAQMLSTVAGVHDPLRAVEALTVAYVAFATKNAEQFALMFESELRVSEHPGLIDAAGSAFGVLLRHVAQAQETGDLADLDPRDAAAEIWSLAHGVSTLANNGALLRITGRDDAARFIAPSVGRLLGARG
jgi:AcrR family transcriptional regulator